MCRVARLLPWVAHPGGTHVLRAGLRKWKFVTMRSGGHFAWSRFLVEVSGNSIITSSMGWTAGFLSRRNHYNTVRPFVVPVGRPGLDPDTLRSFQECAGSSLDV